MKPELMSAYYSAVPLLLFKELLLHYAFEACIMRPVAGA